MSVSLPYPFDCDTEPQLTGRAFAVASLQFLIPSLGLIKGIRVFWNSKTKKRQKVPWLDLNLK